MPAHCIYSFYEVVQQKIRGVYSLQGLIVKRQRVNIGNRGLTYRCEYGYLIPHQYNKFIEIDVHDDVPAVHE